MDFLLGLKKALAQGITREDYTDIWKKEMDLKLITKQAQNLATQDVTSVDTKNDEVCTEKDPVIPLLKQIAEKQDMVQQQQMRIQQQLNHLQSLHEREQQKLQQQFEEAQKGLSEKVFAIEASLANLQLTVTDCVRKTVLTESLDIQEKLSVITETLYNHMLEEMRKATGVSKAVHKVEKSTGVVADKDSQMLEETATRQVTAIFDGDRRSCSLSNLSVHVVNDNTSVEKMEMPLLETKRDETSARNVCLTSSIENTNALKDTLHHELNTFLVNVQKLLLKPINSEDLSYQVIERIKELLQCEKNLTTEQLLDVQTAISVDVQARLYKVEMCIKNEISKIVSILERNEQSHFQMNIVLEEIEKVKRFLSSELPSRIVSHPKWISVFEKKGAMLGEAKANTAIRNEVAHEQGEYSLMDKLGRHKIGCTASENTQACPSESNSEPVQTIMLMLSMYVLMLLTGYDPKARKKTQGTSQPHETTEFFLDSNITGKHVEPKTHEAKQKYAPQANAVPRNLTDDHLYLMFGQHKEAHFLCDLNYSKLSADEEVCFKLKEIAPGYNLQLKAAINENKNVNFFIQSISGTQDDNLLWPADFTITIGLVNKQPLTNYKSSHWSNFTKAKVLFQPSKKTGRSTFTPLCYIRDDIVHDFLYDNTLTFKISVKYIRKEEETQE